MAAMVKKQIGKWQTILEIIRLWAKKSFWYDIKITEQMDLKILSSKKLVFEGI